MSFKIYLYKISKNAYNQLNPNDFGYKDDDFIHPVDHEDCIKLHNLGSCAPYNKDLSHECFFPNHPDIEKEINSDYLIKIINKEYFEFIIEFYRSSIAEQYESFFNDFDEKRSTQYFRSKISEWGGTRPKLKIPCHNLAYDLTETNTEDFITTS